MSTAYTFLHDIPELRDTVNCLRFSPPGNLLVVGCDDGLLAIVDFVSRRIVARIVGGVPVTAVVWHPILEGVVIIGYNNGSLLVHSMESLKVDDPKPLGVSGPVECLEVDSNNSLLGIVCGEDVIVCKLPSDNSPLESTRYLPAPPFPPVGDDARVAPRSLHFAQIQSQSAAVVSYLFHGIVCWAIKSGKVVWGIDTKTAIGRSALSPDGKAIVVSNLCNGFDCYSLSEFSQTHTYNVPDEVNIPLPVLFVHDGFNLLLGSSSGCVQIVDTTSSAVLAVLRHPAGEIVQSMAYTATAGKTYIATGTAEGGYDTTIRIWCSVGGSKPPYVALSGHYSKVSRFTWSVAAICALIIGWIILSTVSTIIYEHRHALKASVTYMVDFVKRVVAPRGIERPA